MYNESSIKTRLKQINKQMNVIGSKYPCIAIITRTDDGKQWDIGITKYLGVVGQCEHKHIICDNYEEYIEKIEKSHPDARITINDLPTEED